MRESTRLGLFYGVATASITLAVGFALVAFLDWLGERLHEMGVL